MKEKLQNFGDLLATILIDSTLVVVVALITYGVKWIIEKCYGQKIHEIDNVALYYVYTISKYVLISSVFLYAVLDVGITIRKIIKRLTRKK